MEIKTKIFKRKSGKSKGAWVVRIQYFDEIQGRTCYMERQTVIKADATDLRDKLVDEIKKTHGQIKTGERMTFSQLCDICEKEFYKPAVIVEGRKIAGLRSSVTVVGQLKVLKEYFGKRLLNEITTESLRSYKIWRLKRKSKTKEDATVKLTTVNRDLSVMRKMMRYAYGKGWLLRDIFFNAGVIDVSHETARTRLLSREEEIRLLDSCQGERQITYERKKKNNPNETEEIEATISVDNPHLKGMIILALDSGMRRGEIFKLRWQDIDFENDLIRIVGTHTKTERERIAPLSERAKSELIKLKEITKGNNPFPYTDIKRSFATAKRLAGIDDLHFHDLRRTAITRWLQQGTSLAFAGKFAGHSQLQTTMKHYTATDADMIKEMNERINSFHSNQVSNDAENSFIN